LLSAVEFWTFGTYFWDPPPSHLALQSKLPTLVYGRMALSSLKHTGIE
jgi:hypothetical protein